MTYSLMIKLQNLIFFIALAIWRGIPPHLWRAAWQDCEAAHQAEVRRAVWELKKAGKISEDEDGRLWPN